MSIAKALLKKQLIPVAKHNNDTYTLLEEHVAAATKGILGRAGTFFVLSSKHSNAYTLRIEDTSVILITDALLQTIETSTKTFLANPAIPAFFEHSFGITYAPSDSPGRLTTGLAPASARHLIGADMWTTFFYEIFDNATKFVLLHEIAHIKHGDLDEHRPEKNRDHEDIYGTVCDTADLITYGGPGANRFTRIYEREADREAACWHMQSVFRRLQEDFGDQITLRALGSRYTFAWCGIMIGVLYASREPEADEREYTFDHLSFDARLESVWEGATPPLEELFGFAVEGQLMHVITLLRKQIETIVFGEPRKYMISIGPG
jgi:hypothetical protein